MKTLSELLTNPVADALGWTLLHALWQGFAVVLPTAVALHVLRNQSSALRYNVGVFALFVQLLLSGVTFWFYYQPPFPADSVAAPISGQPLRIYWSAVEPTVTWSRQVQYFLQSHRSQFVLVYLIGVAVFTLRLVGGWAYLQRLSQTAAQPATVTLEELTERLRSVLMIRPVVRVRESARIAVPMVVGVLKPVLLLPIGLATYLSPREVEAVLAHELAHVKRHDYAVNLLQSVMEVLYFFHPALWWLSARVREEREHCCDDLAVQACGNDGRTLAQALARVEALRLAQIGPTPALAVAFATRRQQLLYRVRRVLGVATRPGPVISNGSLAGLTLATLLLVSVSVFAVQQDQPKSRTQVAQPQPTRRHKVDKSTEYGMSGHQRLRYVIWKGRKLPASHVARLQRQLDQVMAGELNLDDVKQPDRDILLTIIEKQAAFDAGMSALSEGMAHIDYNNIIKTGLDAANAAGTFPVNVDSVLKEVEKINYDSVIKAALLNVPKATAAYDSLDRQRAYRRRQMDSLSQLMAQRSRQAQALRLQMEKFQFPIDELRRNQDVLNWRKDKLMEQRNALIEKHERLLRNEGKQKLSQAEIEKQLEALQPEIRKLEGNMEELNKQFEALNAKEEEVKQPIDKLQREAEDLDQQMQALSNKMRQQGLPFHGSTDFDHDLNLNLNQDLNVDLNKNLNEHWFPAEPQLREQRRQAERQFQELNLYLNRPGNAPVPNVNRVHPARPARPPRPPKIASPVSPAAPVVTPAPAAAPKPARPVPKPAPVAKPVLAPKPAPAAKSPKE